MQNSTGQNGQQQLPQHAIKVKKHKEQTIIRKITLQSIGPVIQKVEQHIGYLMNQTKAQRQRNQQLAITIADHNLLRTRMESNEQRMQTINDSFIDLVEKRKSDLFDSQRGVDQLKSQLNALRSDLKRKEQKIKELQGNIGNNIKIQRQDKQTLSEMIQEMDRKIAETQQSSITIGNKNTNNFNTLEQKNKKNESLIKQTKMLFEQSNRIIQLFLEQRQPSKVQMQKVWGKLHRAVDKDQYAKDRMTIRAQNQILRKTIKDMIDSALTPDVRSFLPVMLDKMQQIQRLPFIQNCLHQTIASVKQHSIKLKLIDQTIQRNQENKFSKFKENDKNLAEIRLNIEENMKKIKRNQNGIIELNQRVDILKEQIKQDSFQISQSLFRVQRQLIKRLEQQIGIVNATISSLIQDRRQQIYDAVTQLVPKETRDFNQHLKQIIPTIQQTKQAMIQRCDAIQQFGNFLKKQLQNFTYKTTKMKSNISIQINKTMDQLKAANARIDIQQQNMKTLGALLSDIMEIILANLASGTPNYDSEVYVTYNDGIILQSDISLRPGQLVYRRRKMVRQDLRKCLLTSAMQLIDHVIKNQSLSFVNWEKNKPSRFFHGHLFKNYQKIEEGKIRKLAKFSNQKDKSETARISEQLDIDNSFKIDMSKTIQPLRSTGHRKTPSQSMTNEPKKSFNLKLKKLESQRYNSLNRTIDKQQ